MGRCYDLHLSQLEESLHAVHKKEEEQQSWDTAPETKLAQKLEPVF